MSVGLMAPMMLWILMPVYAKTNFGLPENLYGWIPTTNALMCVFVQYPVTQVTRQHPAVRAVAAGMLIYALGVGSVFFMRGFWGFWLSMVIMTIGELILMPTSSTYAAGLSPADMRGRYMSIYGLTWPAALGIAPVMGGYLGDTFGPVTTWYGGLVAGLLSIVWFIALYRGARSGSAALS